MKIKNHECRILSRNILKYIKKSDHIRLISKSFGKISVISGVKLFVRTDKSLSLNRIWNVHRHISNNVPLFLEQAGETHRE